MAERLGQYHLIERIAQGGMGEVFKTRLVREAGFEKIVAIKRMLPHLSSQQDFEKRFCEEARLSAKLNHANIAHVYDFGKLSGNLFLAMEFVEGVDLGTLIEKAQELNQPIPLECALKIAVNALKGLDYAHRLKDESGNALNLIHRDVSPSNILVSFEGEVKLTDFGLSGAKKSIAEDVIVGKYSYLPPEEVLGDPLDRRSDIYSLTLVLYEMLFLKKAFNQNIPKEAMMRSIVAGSIDFSGSSLPDEVVAILKKGASVNKSDRYNTAREMSLEIETVLLTLNNGNGAGLSRLLESWFPEKTQKRTVAPEKTVMSARPIATPSKEVSEILSNKSQEITSRKSPAIFVFLLFITLLVASVLAYLYYWPKYGKLNITSTPTGANIILNGQNTGTLTPAKLDNIVIEKQHEITLELRNHQPFTKSVMLESSKTVDIAAKLERVMKSCIISTNPTNAEVWLNEKKQKIRTPITLEKVPAGIKQIIRIKKESFIPVKTEFFLNSETVDNKEFNFKLESFYSNLVVKIVPLKADIYVDGIKQDGKSPLEIKDLIPQRAITILASMKGYRSHSTTIVPEKISEPLKINLEPFSCVLHMETSKGASITMNGKKMGSVAHLKDASKKTQLISVYSGADQNRLIIRANFEQIKDSRGRYVARATLNFDGQPWAKVRIDNKKAFTTPSSGHKLNTGKHRIKFNFADKAKATTLHIQVQ